MSTLAFFPWLTLPAPVALGSHRLVPHRVGASLEPEPRIIDALVSTYQEPGGHPVEAALLVQRQGRALTADLSPEELGALQRLADAVVFGALAQRGFFVAPGSPGGPQLAFALRRFTGSDPRALHVLVPRRDGTSWIALEGTTRTTRPPAARPRAVLELDPALATAVLDGFGGAGGPGLRDAVAAFNAASAEGGAPAHELLWLVTALGRLLGAAAEAELPRRLAALLGPFVARARAPRRLGTLRRLEAAVEPARPPSASILEAWARDLLRARDACATGRSGAAYWSPEAHLLLGAHVFPAAVEAWLAAEGRRPVPEGRRKGLLACAYLTSLRSPFARRRSLAVNDPHVWRRALQVADRQMARIQLEEVLARSGPRSGPG